MNISVKLDFSLILLYKIQIVTVLNVLRLILKLLSNQTNFIDTIIYICKQKTGLDQLRPRLVSRPQ
jgi:hypothetical protein